MSNNKKQFEAWLFSVIGVAVMFIIVVAAYFISTVVKGRFDFTEEKLYTLSEGTKAILNKLDTPVEIRFYCSQSLKEMPVQLKTYAQRVEELLGEYQKNSKGNIELKKFDPKPDTEAEDSANLDGVEGQMMPTGDKLYMGIAISQLDSKVALPFLSPDREKLLEYDLSRAISRVTSADKPVVGVMSALQVFGAFDPMAMRMGQMQRQNPWVFVTELQRDFDVRQVEMTAEEIPAEMKVLVVVHPKGITDKAQFAIDQFVLRGGKLVAFLDPLSFVDSRSNPQMNPLQAAASGGSGLEKLTKAWGLEFDQNKVAADMNFATRINRGRGSAESAPAVLSLTEKALDANDVITQQIDNLLLPFAGVFRGTPAEGLKQTVLLKTSSNSQLVDRFMAEFSGEQISKDFVSESKELPLALRLTGKFKTAFPEGKPKDAPKPEDGASDTTQPAVPALKESSAEGAVILVGDSDLLANEFSVQVQPLFQIIMPINGNLNLVQNMVEQLSGDNNLIAVRSRATMKRPFLALREMQAKAEERYRDKIKDLEKSRTEAQARLNELQKAKEGNQRSIITPEQQKELDEFQAKAVEVNKELRKEQRNLRRDIDSMENKLKWGNIAGMPALVALFGIFLAIIKRKKTAAK